MQGTASPTVYPIGRIEFDAAELITLYPAQFRNGHKRMLFDRIAATISGTLRVSRWRGDLPAVVEAPRPDYEMREGIFSYPPEETGTTVWHLNFADAELFGYYSGPLLAQDEHQVLEHPMLGSLREALLQTQRTRPELAPRTRDHEPTPYLVKGVQRCISFDTIKGPYGNAFATTPADEILSAATYLDPPSFSNILAMAALPGGYGRYSREEIEDILRTAYIGFSACRAESEPDKAVIHTGNWGCGAFGGNPILMAMLQLLAAWLACVDRLVFHTITHHSSKGYRQAVELLEELASGRELDVGGIIDELYSRGFEWGQSDGN